MRNNYYNLVGSSWNKYVGMDPTFFYTLDHALEQQEQIQTNKPKKKKAKMKI